MEIINFNIKHYECDVAMNIMLRNLICSDFFEWNFNEWRKYTSEELKEINNKKKKK